MTGKQMEAFCVTGLYIRTTNENGAAALNIPPLWQKFLSENTMAQIPGKAGNDIYCIYTEYEKDYTRPYTVVLGCRVEAAAPVPEGFKKITISAGNYAVFTAKGRLDEGIVYQAWTEIWNSTAKRIYTTDFEVYGAKAADPANAEVDIFVATV
jgi:predicted transcriptional regulator YdeE